MHFPLYIPVWDRILLAASINCASPVLAVDLFSENWVIKPLNTSGFSLSFSVPPCWATENIPSWCYLFTADRMLSCDFCVSFSSHLPLCHVHCYLLSWASIYHISEFEFLEVTTPQVPKGFVCCSLPSESQALQFYSSSLKLFLCHVLNHFCLIT